MLYFAPLYLEGLAQNWEILLFVIGVGLLVVEIFVLPGFGIAGISGIIAIITSLAFAMVDNDLFTVEGTFDIRPIIKPLAIVLVSIAVSICGSILLASKIYGTKAFAHVALKNNLQAVGYLATSTHRAKREKMPPELKAMVRRAVSFRSSRRQCSRKAYSTVLAALATPMRSQKFRMERGV